MLNPSRAASSLRLALRALLRGGPRGLARWLSRGRSLGEAVSYETWIARHDTGSPAELTARAEPLRAGPLLSLAPAPLRDLESLQAALGAVRMQIHRSWELLLTHLADASPALIAAIDAAARSDPRVRALGPVPDRSGGWNLAAEAAQGSHLACLDARAELRPHSLLAAAEEIVGTPTIDFLFADHDRKNVDGARHAPFFKPRFHPELPWSIDCFGPLVFLCVSLARSVPHRREAAPAERFDQLLRASAIAKPVHVPLVLSHLRDGDAPIDAGLDDAALRAVQEQLDRVLPSARATPGPIAGTRTIRLEVREPRPLITAIIPTRDGVRVLRRCVDGLLDRTNWKPLELIIVDNGSREPETLAFLAELETSGRAKVLRRPGPFNFSALNNEAARAARGELLALLNDDLEIAAPDWLEQLAAHALRPGIGAVGARLLYPDGRVQHAGVATGVLGLAGHLMRGLPKDDAGPNGWAMILRASTAVTAACLVVRREVFLEVNGFDEQHLAVAFNDVDLCLKIAARGYRNLYVPTSELVHHESWSRGSDLVPEKRERFARELQTMLLRWPDLRDDPFYSPNLTLASEQLEPGSPPRPTS